MDETLAELFVHHPSCGCFEGNPIEAFGVFIVGEEYGAEEMPDALGLYGGWCTIVFRPGESLLVMCAGKVESQPWLCSYPGINYQYREISNDMLMLEHHLGEGEMSDEEYECNLWSEDHLRPETGGREFEAWMVGTGYMW